MPSTVMVTQGPTPEEDYGLAAVAEHNATDGEHYPVHKGDTAGLGIYHDGYAPACQEEKGYAHSPPTPHSNSPSDGMRTRSGRSTRRTDSPFSATTTNTKSRVSKSPATRPKKDRKSKLDRSKMPKLTAPLSVLTKDMETPMKDMDAWVHRSAETRRQEVAKREGYVTRPMNSFMLYRSAYAERTKQWCLQNNHQVVSSVSGESWPMEPPEVRDQFNDWAKTERANHAAAHPDYKFSPSKSTSKRRKNAESDVDDEPSDLDDPEAEYRGGRIVRQKRNMQPDAAYLPSNAGFETMPYYGQQQQAVQEHAPYRPRPQPGRIAYDERGLPYDVGTYTYLPTSMATTHDPQAPRMTTPQTLGGYGLPGGQSEELFSNGSRTATPMQHFTQNQYGQPIYQQYQAPQHQQQQQQQYYQQQQQYMAPPAQMYEHQQYLQSQAHPQQAIDPSLDVAFHEAATGHGQPLVGESHFDNALGDMSGGLLEVEYYDQQQAGPDATLAPSWTPNDGWK